MTLPRTSRIRSTRFWTACSVLLLASTLHAETSVSGGVGRTWRYGEESPFAIASVQQSVGDVLLEGFYSSANKIESGAGWFARGSIDYYPEDWLFVGMAYTYRDGGQWVKHRSWFRFGIRGGALRLIAYISPDSMNMEAGVEARLRFYLARHLFVEPRYFVGLHDRTPEFKQYSKGLSIQAGVMF